MRHDEEEDEDVGDEAKQVEMRKSNQEQQTRLAGRPAGRLRRCADRSNIAGVPGEMLCSRRG